MKLTDDQIWDIWNSQGVDEMNCQEASEFARAIEAEVLRGITGDGRGEAVAWIHDKGTEDESFSYSPEFLEHVKKLPRLYGGHATAQQEQAAPAWEMPNAPELFKFINSQPILQSCLYDLNLLPECCRDAMQWYHMVTICGHFEMLLKKAIPMNQSLVAEQAAPGAVPDEVMQALDRMCQPLHESRLSGVTAEADARCMKIIRDYVLSAAPMAVTPDGWLPIETAPEGELVVVFWRGDGEGEESERHDIDYLEDGVWQRHYDGYEHYMAVGQSLGPGPKEKAPYTHWKHLGAPKAQEP